MMIVTITITALMPRGKRHHRKHNNKRTLNVANDAKMDPPTQVENLRSGGAVIRIFRFFGACFRTCFRVHCRGFQSHFFRALGGSMLCTFHQQIMDYSQVFLSPYYRTDLVEQAVTKPREESAAPRKNHLAEQRPAHVHVGPHDALEEAVVHPHALRAHLLRVEQALGRAVTLGTHLGCTYRVCANGLRQSLCVDILIFRFDLCLLRKNFDHARALGVTCPFRVHFYWVLLRSAMSVISQPARRSKSAPCW